MSDVPVPVDTCPHNGDIEETSNFVEGERIYTCALCGKAVAIPFDTLFSHPGSDIVNILAMTFGPVVAQKLHWVGQHITDHLVQAGIEESTFLPVHHDADECR